MNSQQLIDFLKTGMGTAQELTDELLRQFFNYLIVSTVLHMVMVAMIFGFVYMSLSKGIKLFADDKVSQGWAAGLKVIRVLLVVGSIAYSYSSIAPIIEPLVAPHVWLIKQGIKLTK
jgi:hypothetical protein